MKARIMGRSVEVPEGKVRDMEACALPGRDDGPQRDDRMARQHSRTRVQRDTTPSPPGWPKPSDKWNAAYAQFLEKEKQAGRVAYWWYEAFSLWLPGQVRYRPDFLIQYPDGLERKLHFVEIKGFSRNVRDGITRYKIAAALFPCFDWSMMKRKGNEWEEYK